MVFVIVFVCISDICSASKSFVESLRQLSFLAKVDLVEHGCEVNRQTIAQDGLHKDTNCLNMHPGDKGITVMRLAPSHKSALHSVDFDLELFSSHCRFGGLGWIPLEVTKNKTLFTAGLSKFGFKVLEASSMEVTALVVSWFIFSLQDGDSVKDRFLVCLHALDGPWNHRGSTDLLTIDLVSKGDRFTQLAWIFTPVRPSISYNVTGKAINRTFEIFLRSLGDGYKDSFQILRVIHFHLSHSLFVQNIVQVRHHQVST
mmetsp:Transcript_17952/g.28999  ORF Transcript_17952/g.28999 Transcript_17952/m.28999 type:complete len:258 (+) Transcript_17952:1729-2502(+)